MTTSASPNGKDHDRATGSESSAARTDLDEALREFEEGTKPDTETKATHETLKHVAPVIEYVNAERERKQVETLKTDVSNAVDSLVTGDEFKDFPKSLAEGFLHRYYANDSEFRKAFDERGTHPRVYKRALEKAKEDFATEVKPLLGSKARDDVEAAQATVRGTSETRARAEGPKAKELFGMSDSEFRAFKQSQGAAA